MALDDHQRERIGSYFSRNYVEGEGVEIPSRNNEEWLDWMERRLREVGFYDQGGMRKAEETDDAPPRIFLRGDAGPNEEGSIGFSGKSLSPSHMEFKVWLQHKVEEARLGDGSIIFLAFGNERDGKEWREYKETLDNLTDFIEGLIEGEIEKATGTKKTDAMKSTKEWHHLGVMRKVIGRVDPELKGLHYDSDYHNEHKILTFDLSLEAEHAMDRKNVVTRISQEVVKSLISTSKTSFPSDREVFVMKSGADPKGFRDFSSDNGIVVEDDELQKWIEAKFSRNGQFGKRIATRYRNKELRRLGMMSDDDYQEHARTEIIVDRLIGGGATVPDEWKWVKIATPAMVFLPDLARGLERVISGSRNRLTEIWEGSIIPRGRLQKGLSSEETAAIDWIIRAGFGDLLGGGEAAKGPDEAVAQNSKKLAYNLMTMLQNQDLLTTRPMSVSDYIESFLEGDDSKWEPRRGKRMPNSLIFTDKLKSTISKAEFADFRDSNENAIFRWLRSERARWMYSPPEDHRILPSGEVMPGGYLKDEQDGRVTAKYQFKGDYEGFEATIVEHGKVREVPTARCHPDVGTISALNALQQVQWEINLDLLERVFEIEFSDGTTVSDRKLERGGEGEPGSQWLASGERLITKICHKEKFGGYFPKDRNESEEVALSLVWSRKIINHNANVFWHPWSCDFRGRMSPRCTNLSPQGDDLNKALIRFKHWKPMGCSKDDASGFEWLQVHVHNLMEGVESELWGGDRAQKRRTFKERREWVSRNEGHLREIAKNPEMHVESLGLNHHRQGRREDLQRLAALIEFDRVLEIHERERDWSAVKSGLPIHLDASCNGYQHVSTLLRHPVLASLVNVIPSERPEDLYREVARVAREKHSEDVREFLDERLEQSLADRAFKRIVDRKLAKQPTMTRVYGAMRLEKGIAGKSGRGGQYRSTPQARKWSDGEQEKINKIPSRFIVARLEYLGNPDLGRKHYQKHAKRPRKNREIEGILRREAVSFKKRQKTDYLVGLCKKNRIRDFEYQSDSTADLWMKLLREDAVLKLWNYGSGLYWAILEDEELKGLFWYDRSDGGKCGRLWKEQPLLTKLTTRAYKAAIEEVTGDAYTAFEAALDGTVEASEGRYPGTRWRTSKGDKSGSSGFEVCNYYMQHQSGERTSGGWPSSPESCYSDLSGLPQWYSESKGKQKWHRGSAAKSTSRIKRRLEHLLVQSGKKLPKPQRLAMKGSGRHKVIPVLDWIEQNLCGIPGTIELVGEIKPLLNHVKVSIPRFSGKEEDRIDVDRASSGIYANFVQSLDACHMRAVINTMNENKGNLGFWAVHDSFGTHSSDVEDLIGVVIGTFWEMHQGRDMDKWLETMEGPDGPYDEHGLGVALGKAGGRSLVVKGGPREFAEHWGESTYLIG